jgi:hypothetical protein
MPTLVTHFVEWDAIGRARVRAVCGAWIRRREHVNAPTCPDCRRALARLDSLRDGYDGTEDWNEAVASGVARRRGDV